MNRSDLDRNAYMLFGTLARRGYLRWWHSFTGTNSATGQNRSFFIEYLILNPLRSNFKNPAAVQKSYVQISAGIFPTESEPGVRLVSRYPIRMAKYARRPLYFQVDDIVMSENKLSGILDITPIEASQVDYDTDTGCIEWSLDVNKTLSCHTGIIGSPLFSALNALDSFWHGEGIRTQYRGTIKIGEDVYSITPEECFGYADKHWGRSYNKPWLQLASCDLISQRTGKPLKNSALAIDGCCPRFLFFHLKPQLMMQLTYTGEDFCFSFARPLNPARMKWGTKESKKYTSWHIKGENRKSRIKIKLSCSKSDMMQFLYDEPGPTTEPVRNRTVLAGTTAAGTIDLYRKTPQGNEWLDTLTISHTLCIYRRPDRRTTT